MGPAPLFSLPLAYHIWSERAKLFSCLTRQETFLILAQLIDLVNEVNAETNVG
jgi:hypothetical protein